MNGNCVTFVAALLTLSTPFTGLAGMEIRTAETEYQNGKQEICILLPDNYSTSKLYRVLYVLPVDARSPGDRWVGLEVLRGMNAHNLYNLIIVEMGFEKEPWFGDHAVDPKTRQASYLKEYVVPLIESRYSTFGKPEGRLLLGFSKSGWGAFSLLLTYPDFFGYAAAWDAPITLTRFAFGMRNIFGTPEQFALYRPDLLILKQKKLFQERTRLVLTGERYWGQQTREAHQLLDREGVKHVYDGTLAAPHSWNRTWMIPTLAALVQLTDKDGEDNPRREPTGPTPRVRRGVDP